MAETEAETETGASHCECATHDGAQYTIFCDNGLLAGAYRLRPTMTRIRDGDALDDGASPAAFAAITRAIMSALHCTPEMESTQFVILDEHVHLPTLRLCRRLEER